jgi:putative tryptophan/tyrosine transport system substrate-binding protein
MKRRTFISLVGGAAAAWSFAARAQQSSNKIPVVGVLWHAGSAEEEDVYFNTLVKTFHDLGYVEGKNIRLEHRFPAENPDRFRTLARELVDEKPDAIIAVTNLGAAELKKATSTIPIVVILSYDPVGMGLIESLARPGGNITGTSLMTIDLSGKRLELLKQAVPNLSRVALLTDPKTDPVRERTIKANRAAAQTLGITLWSIDIAGTEDVEAAFTNIAQEHADGVVLGTGSAMWNMRERIGVSAIAHKLPAVTYVAEEVPYGLLLSYGQDFPDFFRRVAAYTDKILKGGKPADLPVEQPTKFKLVLNLKTAKALGLTIPQTLLVSADEVIGV